MNEVKRPRIDFAQVPNKVARDARISLRAKGMYFYLYSKPETWEFAGDRICLETSDGRKMVYAALKELEKFGYLKRVRLTTGKVLYNLDLSPDAPKGQMAMLEPLAPVGQVPPGPSASGGSISNTDSLSNTEKESNIAKLPALQGPQWNILIDAFAPINPLFTNFYRNTTERKALLELVEKFGFDKVETMIKALPEIVSKPYAPKITKPSELRRDIGRLVVFVKQSGEKNSKYAAAMV